MSVDEAAVELVMTLRSPDDIVAIILFGSQSTGKARPDSDVDLLVIVRSGFEQVSVEFRGQLFEITLVSEASTRDWWHSNPDHCVMLWRSARLLHGSAEDEYRLRQFAATIEKSGKRSIPAAEANKRHRAASYQLVSLRALAEHDPSSANLVLGEKMAGYVGDYFALRGLWSPAPKERLPTIRARDPETGDQLDAFADPGQTMEHKLALSADLIAAIYQT